MARIVSHPNAYTGLSLYGLQPKKWKEFDLSTQARVLENYGNVVDKADDCTLHIMTSDGHKEYYLVYIYQGSALRYSGFHGRLAERNRQHSRYNGG